MQFVLRERIITGNNYSFIFVDHVYLGFACYMYMFLDPESKLETYFAAFTVTRQKSTFAFTKISVMSLITAGL